MTFFGQAKHEEVRFDKDAKKKPSLTERCEIYNQCDTPSIFRDYRIYSDTIRFHCPDCKACLVQNKPEKGI